MIHLSATQNTIALPPEGAAVPDGAKHLQGVLHFLATRLDLDDPMSELLDLIWLDMHSVPSTS